MAKYQVGASTYEVPDGIPQEQLTAILTELATRESAAAGAKKQEAPQKQSSGSFLRKIDDAVRGAADTLTFGYADEIAAKLDQLTGLNTGKQTATAPATYEASLKAQRDRDAEGGTARTVGQIGGAFIPLAKGAQVADKTLKALNIVPTAVKTGAVTGATTGALYGSGSAEGDLTDRAIGAGEGAATGAVVGAIAPKVIQGVSSVGGKVVDKAKDLLGVKVPVDQLSPAAQKILKESADVVPEAVPARSRDALERMAITGDPVKSDMRVRELFLSEKARVAATKPQRAVADDEVFKNVGDKLKRVANDTVDTLRKAGDLSPDDAKQVKAVISRAARHNRAITGTIKDEELASELARGFKTDDAIIDALEISKTSKEALKNAVRDLDTVTFNSLKKNQGGIFQTMGQMAGGAAGQVAGTPGAVLGRNVGGSVGRLADRVLLQQGTAPVLKRNVERTASGLQDAGIKFGDTVADLEAIASRTGERLAKNEATKASAIAKMEEVRNAQNIALARARAPYAEGTKLGPNASPQAVLVEAFEDATGIKHKPGMVQDVLKSLKKDENFGPAFSTEVDQAIKALGNKPGRIDNLTNLVRAVRAKAAEQQALGTLKIRQGQTAEQGAGRIRNAERYNAKVIENTLRDILNKGE